MFEGLWHAVFGLVLLVVTFGGAVFLIAKAITQGAAHDQARCECWDCKNRRVRAVDAAKERMNEAHEQRVVPRQSATGWMTTLELRVGMRIGVEGRIYTVKEITEVPFKSYTVYLKNVRTSASTMVTIKYESRERRLWKQAEDWKYR